MARWRALEEYTPVARLMVDYMREHRPPLPPSQFAAREEMEDSEEIEETEIPSGEGTARR